MSRRLLAVQGPLQFITGSIALSWLEARESESSDRENTLLLYDFLCPPEVEDSIAEAVRQLAATAPWARVVFLRSRDMDAMSRGRFAGSIAAMQEALQCRHFDEILLARDHIGHGSPLLMNTYCTARKVAYGDSFGLVGQHNAFAEMNRRSRWAPLRRWARKAVLGAPDAVPFDEAVLSLPIDMSGTFFRSTPLVVPSQAHVRGCVDKLSASVSGLADYSQALVSKADPDADIYLCLLSNLANSGLTSPEAEVQLSTEVILSTVPEGGIVLIKRHPRSDRRVLDEVMLRVSAHRTTILMEDGAFASTPIELWSILIASTKVVPIFSTSAINLRYLYGSRVALPLTDEMIHRHFLPARQGYAKRVMAMIRDATLALDRWNGSTPLWEAPA